MLNLFKKKKLSELYAPVTGKLVSLDCVPDPVFSSRMMGEGVAFEYDSDTICAPCDGKIVLIANTKHAVGINSNGIEILIHVGLDTVNLRGEGFEVLVNIGDKVKQGDKLLRVNREFMKDHNVNLITPMIITTKDIKLDISNPSIVDLNSIVISVK
ncbi:PTS sugar transporter subunit IIA [Anaerorhabdus sp.]|jgi:sugar PTS system EIIA component|uniref:PTS sugar transporter subunit IIA n=1 Tax=Anaerorhabdus sp. TaxID=1872524 RepID=UPI002FC77A6E